MAGNCAGRNRVNHWECDWCDDTVTPSLWIVEVFRLGLEVSQAYNTSISHISCINTLPLTLASDTSCWFRSLRIWKSFLNLKNVNLTFTGFLKGSNAKNFSQDWNTSKNILTPSSKFFWNCRNNRCSGFCPRATTSIRIKQVLGKHLFCASTVRNPSS